jgi:hypothetical protein
MDFTAAITLAEQIVTGIIKVAPLIEQGVASSAPYVQAIGKMLTGTNATQADVDALLATLQADSADFQTPIPDDDGTTTT